MECILVRPSDPRPLCPPPFAITEPSSVGSSVGISQGGVGVGVADTGAELSLSAASSHEPAPASTTSSGAAAGDLPVFLVSPCDGIGGALLACRRRSANVQAHVVEAAPELRDLVQRHCPHVTFEEDALSMDADALVSRVEPADWELLFLIGAPPPLDSLSPISHLAKGI